MVSFGFNRTNTGDIESPKTRAVARLADESKGELIPSHFKKGHLLVAFVMQIKNYPDAACALDFFRFTV